MRKLFTILTLAVVLCGLSTNAFSQVQPTYTTTSAAVTQTANFITVTSATGFTASTTNIDYGVFIDHEFMRITSVSSTRIGVQRGQANTNQSPHKSGATVFVGTFAGQPGVATGQTGGPFIQNSLVGSCTRSDYGILPLIQVNANRRQAMYNCNGGQWLEQTLPDDVPAGPLAPICNIAIGSVAYASVGTNTADIASKSMRTTIWVPYTQSFTGIQVLQGGTATTDNITVGLFDAGGKRIATSAAAGTLLSGASTFKSIAFALNRNAAAQTLTMVTGPALYWVAVTGNGTAAGAYQTVPASTFKGILTDSATSQTFGTWPDFTPVTTFTADVGPVVCLYN